MILYLKYNKFNKNGKDIISLSFFTINFIKPIKFTDIKKYYE